MEKVEILMVDDDEEMCEEFKEILESEGYTLDMVHDGEKAKHAIEKDNYKVILLDLKMPKIDGRQVLKYLKEKLPDVKVIILTGSPLSQNLVQGEPSQKDTINDSTLRKADAIITKPFDIENVLEKIKKLTS